ncbi:SIR2 family protein [Onishia niordana]|uniref:SIR2 family protein n=1 Tax=Onishia niordana TaxID=2508711 RepID=UPI0010A07D69|nr:SIR2 family protein [Halomonas niordiana]
MAEINFLQGSRNALNKSEDNEKQLEYVRQKISDFFNIKNINFLFGSGVSSGAIPTMKEMLHSVVDKLEEGERNDLIEIMQEIIGQKGNDLEEILGVLYSQRAYLQGTGRIDGSADELVELIEDTIFKEINVDLGSESSEDTLSSYKKFYQKVARRHKDYPRVNIFTTNNDLFNETSLDSLNIDYNNGFGGGLRKFFNPARFDYTYSKKLETEYDKYEPVSSMVYLYKLHGSISWKETSDSNSYFNIEEVDVQGKEPSSGDNVLVYPTPLKQNKSLGAPYSDLIRELQRKLLLKNSVLFVVGYSFSDEHINNAIYQALSANSSLSIVLFGNYMDKPICGVDDNRVYSLFGEIEEGVSGKKIKIHYFEYLVENVIPDLDVSTETSLLEDFVNGLQEAGFGRRS